MWEVEVVWEWNSRQPEQSLYLESMGLASSWLKPFLSPRPMALELNQLKLFLSPQSRELGSLVRPQ